MTYISNKSLYNEKPIKDKIKVILIDDSNVALSIFERVLLSCGQIDIVGSAKNACDALTLMAHVQADIILLDIEMPNRSGMDALPDIIEKAGNGKVIIVSAFVDSNGPAAIKALSLGACDTLSKPGKNGLRGDFSKQLINKVIRLGKRNIVSEERHLISNDENDLPHITKPEAILIGASTGGIPAIQEFLEYLSSDVSAPIFIAQHLPDAFISYFARQLGLMGKRNIISVYNKIEIKSNNIYLAPGNGHMVLEKSATVDYVFRKETYSQSNYTPSVDALFHSAVDVYGSNALAILMSGMGRDGCEGARTLHSNNSEIWSQDEESSVVWGMPGSAVKDGVCSAQLKPKAMAKSINRIYSL